MDTYDISISIVNYNSTELTIALLNSIKSNLNNINYEILIVDNASTDSIGNIFRHHPDANIIRNANNVFFTKADNQNLSRANGKYIVSINPDTLVLKNTIENMIKFLDNNPDVGAVTPKFIYPDGTLQPSIGRFITFIYGIYEFSGINYLFPNNKVNRVVMQPEVTYDPIKPQEAEVLYGACIMIRHEILETVGLKDENLVHGWDEYDWCKRISNHGWKLYYTPDSELIHYRGATRKKADGLKVNLHKYHLEGLFYLYKKHYGISKYILLKIIWYIKNIFIFPFFITRKIFNA